MSSPEDQELLKQVVALGFVYHKEEGAAKITHRLPNSPVLPWCLQLENDRWILYIKEVPQIVFHPNEVLKFLKIQRAKGEARPSPSSV